MRVTVLFGGLAATGSDVTPWLLVAGIIVLLGVIALVIAGVVRSRRAEREVEDAAEAEASRQAAADAVGAGSPASDAGEPPAGGADSEPGDGAPKA